MSIKYISVKGAEVHNLKKINVDIPRNKFTVVSGLSGSYIDKLVDFELNSGNLSDLDKALLQEIVYGVTRWKSKLDWVLIGFFHGDFQKCFNYVKNALRIGLYQILYLDKVPNSAAIDEAVEIVKRKQGKKTAGLINGVLRNRS